MSRSKIVQITLLTFLLGMASLPAWAVEEEKEDEGFRLISYALHVDSGRPEVCLSFNKAFPFEDRASIAALITLRESGVRRPPSSRDVSLTHQEICIQSLQYKKRYQLGLKGLRSEDGERLAPPVSLSFTVPDRKPSLAFISDSKGLFPRHGRGGLKDVQQKAVNISSAQLTLYRLEDKALWGDIWGHYKTLDLVPSESLTFAREHGKVVWQDHLVFGTKPNMEQNLPVPMPEAGKLQQGVYFLAASPEIAGEKNSALHAGLWFLVSDLRVRVLPAPEGFSLFSYTETGSQHISEVRWLLFSKEKKLLAEGKTDTEGFAFIKMSKSDKKEAAFLVAETKEGSVDYRDLRSLLRFGEQDVKREEDRLLLAKPVYLAGEKAVAVLLSFKKDGEKKDGVLKILRPDQTLFEEQRFEEKGDGLDFVSLSLPQTPEAGMWRVLWQGADGAVRTETPLRLSPDGSWPEVEITSDTQAVETDGLVSVHVKAREGEKFLAWREGTVVVRGARPSYSAFKKFQFGGDIKAENILVQKSFMTREDGTADVRLPIPSEAFETGSLLFEAKLEKSEASARLSLPVKTEQGVVGVAMIPGNGPVAENGVAVFQVVALDASGSRRTREDLSFQVYEEGQRFAWTPSEGRWDYTPLPQRRRLGGGRIHVGASGDTLIKWPVTAGQYVLEITDEQGRACARHRFEAVWDPLHDDAVKNNDKIVFKQTAQPLKGQKSSSVIALLKEDALVTFLDENGHKKFSRRLKAGKNVIPYHGEELYAVAFFADEGRWEKAKLSLAETKREEASLKITTPSFFVGGMEASVKVVVPRALQGQKKTVRLVVIPEGSKTASSFTAMTAGPVVPDQDGTATLRFKMPELDGALRLIAVVEGEKLLTEDKVVSVYPALRLVEEEGAEVPLSLIRGDKAYVRLRIENRGSLKEGYTYKITASGGVKIDGTVEGKRTFSKNENDVISFSVTGNEARGAEIRFEMISSSGKSLGKTWPLAVMDHARFVRQERAVTVAPDETMSLPLAKGEKKEGDALWVSPIPLSGVLSGLRLLSQGEPYTTREIAGWLEAARLWKPLGESMGFDFVPLYALRLQDLRARQNADGGFPVVDSGEPSDLASTAAAVGVLQQVPGALDPSSQTWLKRRLENAWFEETERSARAAALLALGGKAAASMATSGKGDLSVLRYLAESSRGRDIEASTAAEIALALAQNKDEDEARFWIEAARTRLAENKDYPQLWLTLSALVRNPLVATEIAMKMVEEAEASSKPESLEEGMDFLQTLAALRDRYDEKSVILAGSEKKWRGVLSSSLSTLSLPSFLKNTSKERLFVSEVRFAEGEEEKLSSSITLQRQLYHLDGRKIEAGSSLAVGELFLVLVQSSTKLKKGFETLVVSLPQTAGVDVIAVRPLSETFSSLWSFLPSSLNTVNRASFGKAADHFEVEAKEGLQLAFLMQARQSGSFSLSPAIVRDVEGHEKTVSQNKLRLSIR